jgi:hypothetical protein
MDMVRLGNLPPDTHVLMSPERVDTAEGPLPARIVYVVIGQNGEPDFEAEIWIVRDRPEVVRFTAAAKPDGGLRSVDIGRNVDAIIRHAFEECSMYWRDVEIGKKADRARRGRPRRMTPALLAEVARIYLADTTGAPTKAVQDVLGLGSRRSAQLYVQKARAADLLPPVAHEPEA